MPLINCQVELKLKWTKCCVLSAANADNANDNSDIIFIIKDTKFYVPVVTLSADNNKKLSILLSKGFKRSVNWNEYKSKSEDKNTLRGCSYGSDLAWLSRLARLGEMIVIPCSHGIFYLSSIKKFAMLLEKDYLIKYFLQ